MKIKLICEKCSTPDKKVDLDIINQNLTCPKCGKVYQENFQEINDITIIQDGNLRYSYNVDDEISFGKEKNSQMVKKFIHKKLLKRLFKHSKKDVKRYELTINYEVKAFFD